MPQFESSQWVPYPIEMVFAFFANPNNLPHMIPPEVHARIEDLRIQPPPPRPVAENPARRYKSIAAGVGTEILISFHPLPFLPKRFGWTARIVEFAWNDHFADEQVKGPFASFRHRHSTIAEVRNGAEGTLVTDHVEYKLPFGALGRLSGGVVRSQMEKGFEFRRKRLPEILAVVARQAVQTE